MVRAFERVQPYRTGCVAPRSVHTNDAALRCGVHELTRTTSKVSENTMNPTEELARNTLLGNLPEETRRRLTARLDRVDLPTGHVLSDIGRKVTHTYFPTTAVVTLHHVLQDCFSAEVAIIGREGVVGLGAMFDDRPSADRAVVLQGGQAPRIDKRALKWEFFHSPELQQVLVQYTYALMGLVAQTAVCNRHHRLDQRLCRWLLAAQDRLPSNRLAVTQEFLSHLLGVRREGVTQAAGRLQKSGLIQYRRGQVSILDRNGLEAGACECYKTSRDAVGLPRSNGHAPQAFVRPAMSA
jgi:CRP-like cAMP-binding protein